MMSHLVHGLCSVCYPRGARSTALSMNNISSGLLLSCSIQCDSHITRCVFSVPGYVARILYVPSPPGCPPGTTALRLPRAGGCAA